MSKSGLGRGLSSLISEKNTNPKEVGKQAAEVVSIEAANRDNLPTDSLSPGEFQPRSYFDETELQELAESIKKNGIVQPIIVRKKNDSVYEIIAGERRWRAAKINGMVEVPAIIMDLDDRQSLEIGIVENVQRQNLKAVEEAEGYQRLIDDFSYTQEALSEVIGKSRSQIANSLRILSLPVEVKDLLNQEKISAGHARAIIGASEPLEAANEIIKKDLSVRQTEQLVKRLAEHPQEQRKPKKERDPEVVRLEKQLSCNLGLEISIQNSSHTKGKVVLNYNSLQELDDILKRLEK